MITVGFIGLGSQGGPMATRIIDAGFPTLLWARRPESLAPYANTKAQIVKTLAELAAGCEHIGICVVDDAGVTEICEALLPSVRPGTRIVIHATIHPATCIALAKKFAARGAAFIDAPVSGGGPGAAAGTLTVMAGGDATAIDAAEPIFKTFAGLITHLGPVGAGQYGKLINNALMAANMALADAALTAGASLGLDRTALIELIRASTGRSFAFDIRARLQDLATFAHGAKLLAKDAGILAALLGQDPGAQTLLAAADPFLARIAAAQPQDNKP